LVTYKYPDHEKDISYDAIDVIFNNRFFPGTGSFGKEKNKTGLSL
jgi:hypothetical protein